MNEHPALELRLAATFDAYADRAPIEVDAIALARTIVNHRRWSATPLRWFASRGLAAQMLLAALLLVLAAAIAVVGAKLLFDAPPAPAPYEQILEPVGQMTMVRESPFLAQLPDGRVLIAGGSGDEPPAEIFDPATGASHLLEGPTPSGTRGSMVPLPDGDVFVIAYNGNHTSSRAWVFDAAAEAFHELPQPGEPDAPPFGVLPGVALLGDGRVLVAGGTNNAVVAQPDVLASALLFDPAAEAFTPTGSMNVPRSSHSMTLLPDGRVLVAGGYAAIPERLGISTYGPGEPLSSAEIYDPATGTFTLASGMPRVLGPNLGRTLPDGRVLVMSAWPDRDPRPPVAIDIYDPDTDEFSAAAELSLAIDDAAVLRDGRILIAGTNGLELGPDSGYRPWAAIFDPEDGTVQEMPAPQAQYPGVVALRDGTVLFAGGFNGESLQSPLEVFR